MNKLEQAARALLAHWDTPAWKYLKPTGDLMADLREALAEPELNLNCKSVQKRLATVWGYVKAEQAEQSQLADASLEPVAWALTSENGEVLDCISHTYKVTQPCTVDYDEPLYAAPVRTKDLTDDEIDKVLRAQEGNLNEQWFFSYARAVIAADREKNK